MKRKWHAALVVLLVVALVAQQFLIAPWGGAGIVSAENDGSGTIIEQGDDDGIYDDGSDIGEDAYDDGAEAGIGAEEPLPFQYDNVFDTALSAPVGSLTDYEWEQFTGVDIDGAPLEGQQLLPPGPRHSAAMAYDETNGKVVMFGGQSVNNYDIIDPPSSDILRAEFTGGSDLIPEPVATTVFVADGTALLDETWIWDGAEQLWQEVNTAGGAATPAARKGAAMAYDPACGQESQNPPCGQVLLFGGQGAGGALGDTWLWDGNAWQEIAVGNAPGARSYAQMAYYYDEAGDGKVVLFGGVAGGVILNDTWVWDGTAWEEQMPATSPPALYAGTMAFDGESAVLFGGNMGLGSGYESAVYELSNSDYWTWNGSEWTGEPGPENYLTYNNQPYNYGRWGHAMAYDGHRVIYYGGMTEFWFGSSGGAKSSFERRMMRPSDAHPHLDYNVGNSHMVYSRAGGAWEETWKGTGAYYAYLQPPGAGYPQAPTMWATPRSYASMAFDGTNFVLFGGIKSDMSIYVDSSENVYRKITPHVTNETWTFGYIPPSEPLVRINEPIVAMLEEPAQEGEPREDIVSVITDVYGGTRPISQRGLEYRLSEEEGAEWTQVPIQGGDGQKTGSVTVQLTNVLQWQKEYELRAYAVNAIGTGYSQIVSFTLTDDPRMEEPDVEYIRVGPAFLHSKDRKRIVAVGTGITNLLRKPESGIDYRLRNGNDEYVLSHRVRSDAELELTWEEELPDGTYDLVLDHLFYSDAEFPEAVTIVSGDFYKPRNFGTIEVNSVNGLNSTDKLALKGWFVETPEDPGLYTLSDLEQTVAINDSVLFEGTQLEVDKRTAPHTIRGNGRIYVNSVGTAGVPMSYTLFEGEFEMTAADFSILVPDSEEADYLEMGFPVKATSVSFTQTGVRLAGMIDFSFYAGDRKVDGLTPVQNLEFNRNRFDLAGSFAVDKPFVAGPLESSGLVWSMDTRSGYASAVASAQMTEYDIHFDMLLGFKQNRLDGIGFGMYRSTKAGASGTSLNYLHGSIGELSRYSQLPQTFRFTGSATDVFSAELSGLRMIQTYSLGMNVSKYGYSTEGDMLLYWFPVTDLEKIVALNPKASGIPGMDSAGMAAAGHLNAFDLLVGPLALMYTEKLGISGYMEADIHVPNQVPVIGGKTIHSVPVAIDAEGMYASYVSGGIGVNLSYSFAKNTFEFVLSSLPPKKTALSAAIDVRDTITAAAGALEGDPDTSLVLSSGYTNGIDSFGNVAHAAGVKRALPVSAASAATETVEYELKQAAAAVHPAVEDVSAVMARLEDGQLAAIARVTAPEAELTVNDPSGFRTVYSFETDRPYEGLIVLEGDRRGIRLTGPSGQAIASDSTNTVVRGDETYFRVSLNAAGVWRLAAPEAVRFTVYECSFINIGDISDLVNVWEATDDRIVSLFPLERRGKTLVAVSGGARGGEVLYKPDGRPYALETEAAAPDWNAYRDSSDGRLYALVDVAETGAWFVDGGGEAVVNVYVVAPETTMAEVRDWVQAGSYPTQVTITPAAAANQVLLRIFGADENTVVLRPDGMEYALRDDPRQLDWNAWLEEERALLTVLLDPAEAGNWTVRGGEFTDVLAYTISTQFDNLRPLYVKGDWSRTVRLDIPKPGRYMLTVIGGDEHTKITGPMSGEPMTLVFDDASPEQNAIVQRRADRQIPNGGTLDDAATAANIPDPGEADALYVTLNAEQAGTWTVASNAKFELMLTELTALPELVEADAGLAGTNRFEVQWNVRNAAPDTRVTVMVTDNPDRPIGEAIASNLPAAGVRTIDIPSGFVPGQYYLTIMAVGSSGAPVIQVISKPFELSAAQTLPEPGQPELVSVGNGEVTLRLQSVSDAAVSYYRVFVLNGDAPDYGMPAFDIDPGEPEAVLAGLETGQTYRFAVMAIGEKNGEAAFSPLSASMEAHLPEPSPAVLDVGLAALSPGPAVVAERSYLAHYGEVETLLITSAEAASVAATSNQDAQLTLYVNGTLMESKSAEADAEVFFDLNQLLGAERLKEREYSLLIESVNDAGDRSSAYRRLHVDRTEPYLYAAYGTNPEEGLNGLVVNGDRLHLIGQTDPGGALTVNGKRVPLNEAGQFVYYMPIDWPAEGVLAVHMIAEDAVGNRTEYGFEVLQSTADNPVERQPAELAALTLSQGSLQTAFHPGTSGYVASLPEGTVRVFAVPADSNATVRVNGREPEADGAVEIDVPATGVLLTIQVEGAGGIEETYTVQVVHEASNIALLGGLTLSDGAEDIPLNLGFTAAVETYAAGVRYEVDEVSVRPTALQADATVLVNGNVVPAESSATVELTAGATTTVEIVVASPDGSETKTYSLGIWREADSNVRLQQLSIDEYELIPLFDGAVSNYRVVVPAEAASISVAAQAEGEGAIVRIDGEERESANIPLTRSVQDIKVEVVALSGEELTYTITVRQLLRQGAKPPLLEQLSSNSLRVQEPFSPYRFSYTAASTTAARATFVAEATDAESIVTVNGESVNSSGEATVNLARGGNTVIVRVESADRMSSQSYSIYVERQVSAMPQNPEDIRTAPVQTGSGDDLTVPIARSRAWDGSAIDTVSIDAAGMRELVERVRQGENGFARIVVTDLPESPADEYELILDPAAVEELATGGILLNVSFPHAEVAFSLDVIRGLQERGSELYFRIVPIRDTGEQSHVDERLLDSELVHAAAEGGDVLRIGLPLTIETNYSGFPTRLTFPVDVATLPPDALAVYIEHSDGERALHPGTIRYGGEGRPEGVEIEVNKFSTFTLIGLPGVQGEATELSPYISGYPDGMFRPNQALTRAELAAMLSRLLAFRDKALPSAEAGNGQSPYADVSSGHWAFDAIMLMGEHGLMIGDEKERFRPSDTVTRGEMATIAMRWNGWSEDDVSAGPSFADTEGHWAYRSIARMQETGVLNGYPDDTFRPNASLTRAEAVRIMNALLQRPLSTGFGASAWPDVPANHWARADIESASSRMQLFPDGSARTLPAGQ